jgi:DNA-binding transcriptional LysR family regulator
MASRLPPTWFARARLKLRHLQLLAALDDTRNLNRAAQGLGITQPAASKLLAEIEAMVGTPVFERRPRGLSPNAAGEVLLRRARSVLVELEQAAAELNSLRDGAFGHVALGTVTAPAVDIVARAVEAVQRAQPNLRVSVEVDASAPLVERLLAGRLDMALARMPPDVAPGLLDYLEVGEEAVCLLVPADHPLPGDAPSALAALLDYPWVLPPPHTLLRQEVDALFLRAALPRPARVLDTESILLAMAALAQGPSICAVTASVAALLAPDGRYRRLPPLLDAPPLVVRPYGLIRSRLRPLSPAASRLHHQLCAELFRRETAGPA